LCRCVVVSLCRCVVVSLCRCVVVSLCRCVVVSLCRCVVVFCGRRELSNEKGLGRELRTREHNAIENESKDGVGAPRGFGIGGKRGRSVAMAWHARVVKHIRNIMD